MRHRHGGPTVSLLNITLAIRSVSPLIRSRRTLPRARAVLRRDLLPKSRHQPTEVLLWITERGRRCISNAPERDWSFTLMAMASVVGDRCPAVEGRGDDVTIHMDGNSRDCLASIDGWMFFCSGCFARSSTRRNYLIQGRSTMARANPVSVISMQVPTTRTGLRPGDCMLK